MSKNSKEINELKNAVRNLKLCDIYAICSFASISKNGRKMDVIERVHRYLEEDPNFAVRMKIKEICRKNGATNAPMTRAAANGLAGNSDVPGSIPTLPNIRPHPSHSNYQHVPAVSSAISSHLQPTAIMRLHPQQLSGNVAVNPTMSSGTTMTGTVHHQNPAMNVTNLPVHPDVRLSPHPFYEQQQNGELMRIKTLMNNNRPFVSKGVYEATFPFHLSPQQANMIFENRVEHIVQKRTDFGIQVLVRFCKYDTSTEQDDALPIHLSLRCNGTPVPLCNPIPTNKPGMDGRRLGRPINITPQVRVSPTVPNFITVNWHFDPNHHLQAQIYALGVYLVKRLSPKDLMNKLNKKGVKPAEFAKYMIKEKMTSLDAEITTNKLRTSLRCPLGKMRIETPLRAQKCTHLQCFDAYCYLAMNERRPTWRCPFCDNPATFSELYIDGFFKEILNSCDSFVSKIEFSEDGSWTRIREDEEEEDADDTPPSPPPPPPPPPSKSSHVPPLMPHQIIQQEQSQCVGDNANGGDASVIDLTEGSDEESAAEKPVEKQPVSAKREMESSASDAGNSKRMRASPQSPEVICLDSSDEEDDNTQAGASSPRNGANATSNDVPDSTTAVGQANPPDPNISSSNPASKNMPMPVQNSGTTSSDPGSAYTGNTNVPFPANSAALISTAPAVTPYLNTSNNPQFMPGSVFPGNSNNFYQS